MIWNEIKSELMCTDLQYPVLMLTDDRFVEWFPDCERFVVHLQFAKMGLERNSVYTHWAHLTMPSETKNEPLLTPAQIEDMEAVIGDLRKRWNRPHVADSLEEILGKIKAL